MPRTTPELVGTIIEVDSRIALGPFIVTANQLVTEICAPSGKLSVERLELIERYLSAHFYTLRDPRPVMEQAGDVQQTNQSKVDLFLCTSHYGQTAIMLDTTGGLAELNREPENGRVKRTLSVSWVGTYRQLVFPGRKLCIPDNR